MSSVIGNTIKYSTFGESHGPLIGMTIHNLPSGIAIDSSKINSRLARRKTGHKLTSTRREADRVRWLSGVTDLVTTGAPLTFVIDNIDRRTADYQQLTHIMRPSHADYTAHLKYGGWQTKTGGGIFSGRLTALYVVAGSVISQLLNTQGIVIQSSVTQLGDLTIPFAAAQHDAQPWLDALSPSWRRHVTTLIRSVQSEGDSLGGEIETRIEGLAAGLGEPNFDSTEAHLARYLFAIPGLKALQFGLGTEFAQAKASRVNDEMRYIDGTLHHLTNHNGGVIGGITNGMPVVFRCTFKPTPSIAKAQQSVDIRAKDNVTLYVKGRHDPAYVIRTPVIVESVAAMALYDLMRMALR